MATDSGIAAVVLAAGASRRFGEANKLLARLDGQMLIERSIDALLAGGVANVVVVTGWDRDNVVGALDGRDVRLVHNPDWEAGMGGSIGVGIGALDATVTAAFIVPGDMPLLTPGIIAALVGAFDAAGRDCVVYPATQTGEQRNPVLWPRRFFAELQALAPAEGAKPLLKRLPATGQLAIEVPHERSLIDVDTPTELEAARAGDLPI